MRCVRLLVLLGGCGRVGFNNGADASDAPVACPHTFCDDFERTTPVDTGWTSATVTGGATLAIDDTVTRPPPGSLEVTFDQNTTGQAYLDEVFVPIAQTEVDYAFGLEIDTADSAGEIDLADMIWSTNPAPCTGFGFFIVRTRALTPPQVVLQETYNNCAGGNLDTPILPAGALGFHDIEVNAQIGAANIARVRVTVDGVLTVDHAAAVDVPASQVKLLFGAPSILNPDAPWILHFDALTVDVR